MTNDPTARTTAYQPAELVWTAPCPRCSEPCTYFQRPSEAQPRPRCLLCDAVGR